jgi:methanogenic corrinoid protein MtbC1
MRPLEEILKTMRDAVVDFDEGGVRLAAEALIEEGYNPLDGILHGLSAGMETVGKLFKAQEYFVPEVLLCAEAMTAGLEILQPRLPTGETKAEGTIVLGTVQGDIHDLGKNLVKMMLEIGGFTVFDLGNNVPHDRFVDEMIRTDADLVGISAMMTTTMMAMKGLIQKVKQAKPGVGVLIGGAPITREIVMMFKADGYSASAAEVLEEARRVMATIKAG